MFGRFSPKWLRSKEEQIKMSMKDLNDRKVALEAKVLILDKDIDREISQATQYMKTNRKAGM